MFNYPDDFDISAYPAGKSVAVSRYMATAVMIVFLLVMFLCGVIVYINHSQQIHPFLVSTDFITGRWTVADHDHGEKKVAAERAIKEYIIGNFAKNWFTISADKSENDRRWASCSEKPDLCIGVDVDSDCAIFCNSNHKLFTKFKSDVFPLYMENVQNGIQWRLNDISTKPMDTTDTTWILNATVVPSVGAEFKIISYITMEYDDSAPMGYVINDFNAYRLWGI